MSIYTTHPDTGMPKGEGAKWEKGIYPSLVIKWQSDLYVVERKLHQHCCNRANGDTPTLNGRHYNGISEKKRENMEKTKEHLRHRIALAFNIDPESIRNSDDHIIYSP